MFNEGFKIITFFYQTHSFQRTSKYIEISTRNKNGGGGGGLIIIVTGSKKRGLIAGKMFFLS